MLHQIRHQGNHNIQHAQSKNQTERQQKLPTSREDQTPQTHIPHSRDLTTSIEEAHRGT